MTDKLELILVFAAVLTGVLSAAYFYLETGIFMKMLQRPLKLIAFGMFIISIGVLLSAYISYTARQGVTVELVGVPLSAAFYWLYLLGSILIAFGASNFTRRPKPVQNVSL
jgi:hypothetical protein